MYLITNISDVISDSDIVFIHGQTNLLLYLFMYLYHLIIFIYVCVSYVISVCVFDVISVCDSAVIYRITLPNVINHYLDGQELALEIDATSDAGIHDAGMVCCRYHVMLFMRVFVVMKFSI